MEVSKQWFLDVVAQGKSVVIVKFDDAGMTLVPPEITSRCTPKDETVACTSIFAGDQGRLSTFVLVALALSEPPVPGIAMKPLGDNFLAMWHFNNATKEWLFFAPQPEFAGFNSISALVPGRIYMIDVAQDQMVILNHEERFLTAGLNYIVW